VLKRDEEYASLVEASLSTLSKTYRVERNQDPGTVTYSVRSGKVEYKVFVGRNVIDAPPISREHAIMISWGSLPAPFVLVPSSNVTYFDLNFGIHSPNLDGISLQLKRCLEERGFRLVGFSADAAASKPRSKLTLVTRVPKFLYRKLSRRYHSTRDLLSMRVSMIIARPVTRKKLPALDGEGEIVIRQAREDDLSQIFDRFGEVFLVRPRHRMIRRCLRYFGATFLVAERDGRIIGFSFCSLFPTFIRFRFVVDGLLNNIAVVGEHRKLGVGGRLLGQTTRRLTAMGVRSLHLAVDSDNVAAISMCRHAGFEETTMLSGGQREYTLQLGKKT
jgi:ribosomal protein S18 acetylase RimI-like enzyme